MRPDGPRPLVVGPDTGPEPPYPLRLNGKVIKGFGRGSSEVRIQPIPFPPLALHSLSALILSVSARALPTACFRSRPRLCFSSAAVGRTAHKQNDG